MNKLFACLLSKLQNQSPELNALSTSLFVMGEEKAVDFWRSVQDFDFVILTKDKRIIYSKPLEKSITLLFDFDSVKVVE